MIHQAREDFDAHFTVTGKFKHKHTKVRITGPDSGSGGSVDRTIALLPAASYNFLTVHPWVWMSIVNVFGERGLDGDNVAHTATPRWLSLQWTLSCVVLIVINMSLYLSSVL